MDVRKIIEVLVIAAFLIIGSSVAVFVYNTMQDDRIAYISVKTDKTSYDAGENVTFKLYGDTPNIEFNITDPNNSPQNYVTGGFGEINIVKIPDDITPDMAVDDLSNENQFFRRISTDTYVATIHYDYFSNKQSPLNLSWDGMIMAHNEFIGGISSFPANSGNYVIIPDFLYASNHRIHFNIDRGAIFQYEGLDAGINITNNPSNNVTVKLTLGPTPGTTGNHTCQLYSDFRYSEFPVGNINDTALFPNNDHYHNETLVLSSGRDIIRTMLFDAKIPDHGDRAGDGTSFQSARFDALLVTPVGNYTFGFNGIWDGGWKMVQQY